jgi:ferredoxin-type protein NapF
MRIRKHLLRLLVRLAGFSAFFALLWPVLPQIGAQQAAIQASPFAGPGSSLAVRDFAAGSIIGFAFAGIALAGRRWFCRYACPVGLLLEGVAQIGLKKTSWWANLPAIGRYAALATFGGALVGYPLFLWMDPLAIFSSAFSVRVAANAVSAIVAGFLPGLLVFLGLTSGTLWCARLCPSGGTQELLASIKPGLAKIWMHPSPSGLRPEGRTRQRRRIFLFTAAGVAAGLWARKSGASRRSETLLRPPGAVPENRFAGLCLRCGNCMRACPSNIIHPDTEEAGPAGWLAPVVRYDHAYCLEDCHACTKACPSGSLQSLNLEEKARYVIGEAVVDLSLCMLVSGEKDCDACMRACPFHAVQIHWDEEQYVAYPVIDAGKCNGCGACEVVCPVRGTRAIKVWSARQLTMG